MTGVYFQRNPRIALLVVLLVTITAVGALFSTPRLEDPLLTRRYGSVTTFFPGADAERVEAQVTEPIEDRLFEIAEIEEIASTSRAGLSVMRIEVDETLAPDRVPAVWAEIRQRVDQAAADLPAGAQTPEVDWFRTGAIAYLGAFIWTGDGPAPQGLLTRLGRDLEDRLQTLPGVVETFVYGDAEEEIRVVLDSVAVASLGLTHQELIRRLEAADPKAPAGQVRTGGADLLLDVAGEFDALERIRDIPIARSGDRFVKLGDVARVERGVESPPGAASIVDGRPAVMVGVRASGEVRIDQWSETIRAATAHYAETVSGDVVYRTLFEQAEYTEDRLGGLVENFLTAMAIVALVLFVTMGLKSAIIVGLSLPLTVAAVLAMFAILGVPFHQMSVTGLIIALGLMIDNPIVVIDEFRQEIAKGRGAEEAVRLAVKRLWAPLLASSLTTVFAFTPIAGSPGAAGEFIGALGLSVILSLIASYAVAMTIAPAAGGWFHGAPAGADGRRRWWRDGFEDERLSAAYRRLSVAAMKRPWITIGFSLVLPIAGFLGARQMPMQFFPPTDRDQFQVRVSLPQQTSLARTMETAKAVDAMIRAEPGVVSTHWTSGDRTPQIYYNVTTTGQGQVNVAAGFVETASAAVTARLLPDLQPRLMEAFPDAIVRVLPFEQGPPVDAPLDIRIFGPDLSVLRAIGKEVQALLYETTGVIFADPQLAGGAPKLRIMADEEAARLSGFDLTVLARELSLALEGGVGGAVLEGVEALPVRAIFSDKARADLDIVAGTPLSPAPGAMNEGRLGAPVEALGPIALIPETAQITRFNGRRVNRVYGHLEPFALPAPALAEFRARLDEAGLDPPPGYSIGFGGEEEARSGAVGRLLTFAAPLMVGVVGAIVVTFNSFARAGIVTLVGFLSVGLAFFGVRLFGYPLGFTAIVGALGLVGLAVNGAIVVLSLLVEDEKACSGEAEAIAGVAIGATRHILSTTLTTIGGFIPLIIFGGTFWPPLATAIAGGVGGSALLALFLTPAAFALMVRAKARARAAQGGAGGRPSPA